MSAVARLSDAVPVASPETDVPASLGVPISPAAADLEKAQARVADLEVALAMATEQLAGLEAELAAGDSESTDISAIAASVELAHRVRTQAALVEEIHSRLAAARGRVSEAMKTPASNVCFGRTDMRSVNVPQPDGTVHRHNRPSDSQLGVDPLVVDCADCYEFLVTRLGFAPTLSQHPLTPDEIADKEARADLMAEASSRLMSQLMESATGAKLVQVGKWGTKR